MLGDILYSVVNFSWHKEISNYNLFSDPKIMRRCTIYLAVTVIQAIVLEFFEAPCGQLHVIMQFSTDIFMYCKK